MKKILLNVLAGFILVLSLSSCSKSFNSNTEQAALAMAKEAGNTELNDVLSHRSEYDLYMFIDAAKEGETSSTFVSRLVSLGFNVDNLWIEAGNKLKAFLIAVAVRKDKSSAKVFIAGNSSFIVFNSSMQHITYTAQHISLNLKDAQGDVLVKGSVVAGNKITVEILIDTFQPLPTRFTSRSVTILDSKY